MDLAGSSRSNDWSDRCSHHYPIRCPQSDQHRRFKQSRSMAGSPATQPKTARTRLRTECRPSTASTLMTASDRGCVKTLTSRVRAQIRPLRSAQDRRSTAREGFDDPGSCSYARFSHGLDQLQTLHGFSARPLPLVSSCYIRPEFEGLSFSSLPVARGDHIRVAARYNRHRHYGALVRLPPVEHRVRLFPNRCF